MTTLRLAIVLAAAGTLAAQEPPPKSELAPWAPDLAAAHARAADDGKPVIAYFTFDT